MKVKFWGTRGSLPVATNAENTKALVKTILARAVNDKITDIKDIDEFLDGLPFSLVGSYGGNTSCVEIANDEQVANGDYTLCDLGSGVREFANKVLKNDRGPQRYHIFISHLHWDHIMGFPFFTPAYIPGNKITIYGCHKQLEETFRRQHSSPNFPVEFDQLMADIEFIVLQAGDAYQINGYKVTAHKQLHAGDSYAYRFEKENKAIVYSTDSEHRLDTQGYNQDMVEFYRDSDLVIFDAMYSLIEAITLKQDWGHSNNLTGVELCQRANVKHLCLFHHDPMHNTLQIEHSLQQAIEFEKLTRINKPLVVSSAYDGLQITL